MNIQFTPQRRDDTLTLVKDGEILSINGEVFDFSIIPDGLALQADAFDSVLIQSASREGGALTIALLLPHGATPTQEQAFPQPLLDAEDGVLIDQRVEEIEGQGLTPWPETIGMISLPPEKLFQELQSEKLALLGGQRWQVETGGIFLNGMPIRTDRETIPVITAARIEADNDPEFVVKWKLKDGLFIELSAQQIQAVSEAVRNHVQAAFAIESQLTQEILAATNKGELDAIDILTGW